MTIHGYLTDVNDFGRLYDYLDCYDEVVPVQIPGHNGKVNFKAFTVESTQQAVLSAYDALSAKHDEVDVVGFSMGGALATWLCALRKVHRAVLLSPANKFINIWLPVSAVKFYGEKTVDTYRNAEGTFKQKSRVTKDALKPYGENITVAGKVAFSRTFRYMTPRNLHVFNELVKQSNMWLASSAPISTPTLVLWGKLDELVPYKSVQYVCKYFSDIRTRIYPDVGHAMLYTNLDDRIIKDTMDFLTEGNFDKEVPKRK